MCSNLSFNEGKLARHWLVPQQHRNLIYVFARIAVSLHLASWLIAPIAVKHSPKFGFRKKAVPMPP
jgi:hypothetical protein